MNISKFKQFDKDIEFCKSIRIEYKKLCKAIPKTEEEFTNELARIELIKKWKFIYKKKL